MGKMDRIVKLDNNDQEEATTVLIRCKGGVV